MGCRAAATEASDVENTEASNEGFTREPSAEPQLGVVGGRTALLPEPQTPPLPPAAGGPPSNEFNNPGRTTILAER